MARPYRLQGEDCLYHITSRGDDRKKIFLDKTDYQKFLEYLTTAKERFKFHLYCYCLMGNHYHLLLETTQPNISSIMQYVNTSYTTYYNIKRKRCGHLFQGRYKSILVDADAYFLELTRYIHLNPVKAKIVTVPEEYPWSSCKGYLSKKGDGLIDKDRIKKYLDMGIAGYINFMLKGMDSEYNPFKDVYAGFLLGRVDFIKDKLKSLKERIEGKEFSHKKELSAHLNEVDIIEAVAKHYRKSPEELIEMKTRPATEKKIAMYLLKRLTTLTNNQIGRIFGISFSAASKAAKDIARLIERNADIRKVTEEIISSLNG